jgi:putative transcriptional regulator
MTDGRLTNQVRTLRFLNGEMSQAELGQRIGVTRQTVAAIEAGKYSPSLEAAFRIADVFGKSLEDPLPYWLARRRSTVCSTPPLRR